MSPNAVAAPPAISGTKNEAYRPGGFASSSVGFEDFATTVWCFKILLELVSALPTKVCIFPGDAISRLSANALAKGRDATAHERATIDIEKAVLRNREEQRPMWPKSRFVIPKNVLFEFEEAIFVGKKMQVFVVS